MFIKTALSWESGAAEEEHQETEKMGRQKIGEGDTRAETVEIGSGRWRPDAAQSESLKLLKHSFN